MVPPQSMAVDDEAGKILVDETILVFKAIAVYATEPVARCELAAVFERRAIQVEQVVKSAIEDRERATPVRAKVDIQAFVVVLLRGEGVLPAPEVRRDIERCKKVVLPRRLVEVLRQRWLPFIKPEGLHATAIVGVPQPQTGIPILVDLISEVPALGRIRVFIV